VAGVSPVEAATAIDRSSMRTRLREQQRLDSFDFRRVIRSPSSASAVNHTRGSTDSHLRGRQQADRQQHAAYECMRVVAIRSGLAASRAVHDQIQKHQQLLRPTSIGDGK
jgi:hypothetical protein